jgi:hypothetical protein
VREYLDNGGNASAAAVVAYPDWKYAKEHGWEVLNSVGVRTLLQKAFDHAGLTPGKLAEVISDALTAVTEKGNEDHAIRLRAVELAFKVISPLLQQEEKPEEPPLVQLDMDPRIIFFIAATGREPNVIEMKQLMERPPINGSADSGN